jgi:glycosyltransferase involved in cell wall biosynthesis
MTNKPDVTIIIPAHNEEEGISDVITQLKALSGNYEILVVDDGSTDNTHKLASDTGVKVIRHPYNKGNGAAIKTGARHAEGDILLFMDGDGQHNPEYIPNILHYIKEYDMVVGARTKESESFFIRNLGNKVLILTASYLSEFKIPDLTSGFRVIKKEVFMNFIHLLPNTFSYPTTLTLSLLLEGFNVKFVPIKSFTRTKGSKSKVNPLKDGIRFFLMIIRIITIFNPLKVFLPVSILLFIIGFLYGIVHTVYYFNIPDGAVLLILSSILIFFFGILADQISSLRREIK